MTPIQLTVQRPDNDTVHVIVQGALDLVRAYDFDDAIRRIERDAPGRLVLDLRPLDFLDTTGLARLLAVQRRCRRAGRRLVLVRGPLAVQRIFALCSDEQFELVADPAEVGSTA
ncbi:MAG TPA: STAS domain-containing protein [Solirubrobacteraceae bacterium]